MKRIKLLLVISVLMFSFAHADHMAKLYVDGGDADLGGIVALEADQTAIMNLSTTAKTLFGGKAMNNSIMDFALVNPDGDVGVFSIVAGTEYGVDQTYNIGATANIRVSQSSGVFTLVDLDTMTYTLTFVTANATIAAGQQVTGNTIVKVLRKNFN